MRAGHLIPNLSSTFLTFRISLMLSLCSGKLSLARFSITTKLCLLLCCIYNQTTVIQKPRKTIALSTRIDWSVLLYKAPTTPKSTDSKIKKKVNLLYSWVSTCSLYSHNRRLCSLSNFSVNVVYSFTLEVKVRHCVGSVEN